MNELQEMKRKKITAMKKIYSIALTLFILPSIIYGQTSKLKPLEELINKQEPAWDFVKQWIKDAKNVVEVLPKDAVRADSALYQTQVTTRSPMGTIVYETGGILIDHGWIRILGSGCKRLNRSLMDWNKDKSYHKVGEQLSFLLIADDVLGGFFAVNAGGLAKEGIGKVFYFAPDNLKWEQTEMSYSDFLTFCFSGDINKFYDGYRWTNWINEIDTLDGHLGISVYPFLWSKEGQADINKNSRKPVPMQELWELYMKEEKK
jgi:hypothetical protein